MVKQLPLVVLLAAVSAPAAAQRLPTTVLPEHYDLKFIVDLPNARFDGVETIRVRTTAAASAIVLNAAEITFGTVTIDAAGTTQPATVSLDAAAETATLTVARPVPAGAAQIHIDYRGVLNDKLRGFYLSKTKARNYAVTQFESTDARRAFPCFDEPAFKATFSTTLVIDKGDTAISNGKVVSDAPGPGANQHTMTFSETPRMSTYLVAMAVGDFECLSGSSDNVPIRICTTPGKTPLARIALDSAEQILHFYDGYYAIKYPYGKLDVLAVPDFAAGAMENTAAIFYRETDLLAPTDAASVAARKTIASVLAHEMAHQWFGDLVTMQWWDDIWLNEGFATWMANKPLAAIHPEWDVPVDEALENQTALGLDSLRATRPIHAPANTPAEIDEAFDAIAYQKGAAVLRMIEGYVGEQSFRKGVNDYLHAHAYGNATAPDFWSAIAAASGKPVDAVMPTFVNQPGSPLVSVSATCDAAKTATRGALTQDRFSIEKAPANAPAERWKIPVCVKTPGADPARCVVVDKPEQTVELARGCPPWVFMNAGARGYYRTAYPPDMLRALGPQVETALTAPERIALMGDEWALVRSGQHTAGDFLALASHFDRESSAGALETVTGHLATVREYLTTDATRPKLEAYVRRLLNPILKEVGFSAAASDTDARRELRGAVVDALGTTGNDPTVVSESRAALDRALSGGPPLDPTLATPIVRVSARHGNAALFDALAAAAARAGSPDEHYRYLFALASFTDPALEDRALNLALTPDLRNQDTALYLSRFLANPEVNARAWAFVKAHWAALAPKVAIFGGDTAVVGALGSFCDAASRDDVKAFFAAHPLPAAARGLRQTIERIDDCIALKERQRPIVAEFLAKE